MRPHLCHVFPTFGTGGPEVRTAVLYEKPLSVVRCDFVWRRTDRWINFPWSTPAPVAATQAGS